MRIRVEPRALFPARARTCLRRVYRRVSNVLTVDSSRPAKRRARRGATVPPDASRRRQTRQSRRGAPSCARPSGFHAEDAARALAAVDAFVPHLEHHALAMHDVADAREALDAAPQAPHRCVRPPRRTPPDRIFPLLQPRASRRSRTPEGPTERPAHHAYTTFASRRAGGAATGAPRRAHAHKEDPRPVPAAPADAPYPRQSHHPQTAVLFRDRGASVEAQAAAVNAAAAAVRRVHAETRRRSAVGGGEDRKREPRGSVGCASPAPGDGRGPRGEDRARTTGRAEKASGWFSDSSPEERRRRKKEKTRRGAVATVAHEDDERQMDHSRSPRASARVE